MKEKIKDIRQQTKAQLDRIPWEKVSWMKKYNPFRFIKRLDWYIINKFIGTYFYSIILIISISIVFDINENLAKFTNNQAPLRAIVFDYYTTSSRRCSCSLPSSSLPRSWQATPRSSRCWHAA